MDLSGVLRNMNPSKGINQGDFLKDGLFHCSVCGKPKQMYVSLPIGKDGEKTEVIVRVQCDCDKKRIREEEKAREEEQRRFRISSLRRKSMIDPKFENARFGSFVVNKENEKNFKACSRYVSLFDKMLSENQGLLFWGDVGTGKSFMAGCIANELMDKEYSVLMTSFVKILEELQKSPDLEENILKQITDCDLLILDDLGAERGTDYGLEKVYNIVDVRYRCGKPMILTTNLERDSMLTEPDIRRNRIYDRIFETCYPMHFTGKSWRRIQAKDRFDKMKELFE